MQTSYKLPDIHTSGTDFRMPEDLMPHQAEDISKVLYSDTPVMNFSEMGTGKTAVAIGVVELRGYKRVLVLVPKRIRLVWDYQIKQWTDSSVVVCRRGSSRRLDPLFESYKSTGTLSLTMILLGLRGL